MWIIGWYSLVRATFASWDKELGFSLIYTYCIWGFNTHLLYSTSQHLSTFLNADWEVTTLHWSATLWPSPGV